MKEIEQIETMVREGKITASQGDLLIEALQLSTERTKTALVPQSEKREKERGKIGKSFIAGTILLIVASFAYAASLPAAQSVDYATANSIRTLLAQGKAEEALTEAQQVQTLLPESPDSYALLAEVYASMAQGKISGAEAKMTEANRRREKLAHKLVQLERRKKVLLFVVPLFILSLGCGVAALLLLAHSRLVKKEEETNGFRANVDQVLVRRIDAVDALLAVARESSSIEEIALEEIVTARNIGNAALGASAATGGGTPLISQADEQLRVLSTKLVALEERYPSLSSIDLFRTAQDNLAALEAMTIQAVKNYNQSATKYNVLRRSFPYSLLSQLFQFAEKDYLALLDVTKGGEA